MGTLTSAGQRRGFERTAAVRRITTATAWLSGKLTWREGRVVWTHGNTALAPHSADIKRAENLLRSSERFHEATLRKAGITAEWLQERRRCLDQARRLHGQVAPDLALLVRQSRARNPAVIARLIDLLEVEALCHEGLPASPARALVACGGAAQAPLQAWLKHESLTTEGRALGALVLGAIGRAGARGDASQWTDARVRRAYHFGRSHDLPAEPAVAVVLLEHAGGDKLAGRFDVAAAGEMAVSSADLRAWLAANHTADSAVTMAEAVAGGSGLVGRIRRAGVEPYTGGNRRQRSPNRMSSAQRKELVESIRQSLVAMAGDSYTPEPLQGAIGFVHGMLDTAPDLQALATTITEVLKCGVRLCHSGKSADFVELLRLFEEKHDEIWNKATRPEREYDRKALQLWSTWLKEAHDHHIVPLLELMEKTGNAPFVQRAFEVGYHQELRWSGFRWPELYPWVLDYSLQLDDEPKTRRIFNLCYALHQADRPRDLCRFVERLVERLSSAPAAVKSNICHAVLNEFENGEADYALLHQTLATVDSLEFFVGGSEEPANANGAINAIQALHAAMPPEQVAPWLDVFVRVVRELRLNDKARYLWECRSEVELALALTGGNIDVFKTAVGRLFYKGAWNEESDQTRYVIGLIRQHPFLRQALAGILPRQPQRALRILKRLALTKRLGTPSLASLDALADAVVWRAADPEWDTLLELAPELEALAGRYVQARRLALASTVLPPRVWQALRYPLRITRELAHLQELAEREPGRPELQLRIANLVTRLAERERMITLMRGELREALHDATAEAQLAAVEHLINSAFRQRLETVVGSLPADAALDPELENAALLSADIESNRHLLRKMLRHEFDGRHTWRREHPANVRFLAKLEQAGVNAEKWLGAHPRRRRCAGVPGGYVHLRLEQEPLRILQMGNYFKTCLSVGGCNSFSTVANACELNKRVIYARDGQGRVVGRKLLGIAEDGRLLGFYGYASLSDEPANEALRRILNTYAREFATRCGLQLADDGTVPRLFAQDWYDDGAVPWGEDGFLGTGIRVDPNSGGP